MHAPNNRYVQFVQSNATVQGTALSLPLTLPQSGDGATSGRRASRLLRRCGRGRGGEQRALHAARAPGALCAPRGFSNRPRPRRWRRRAQRGAHPRC